MKTAPLPQCSKCKLSYSEMLEGRIEYIIPWGLHFLLDKYHINSLQFSTRCFALILGNA